MNLRSTLNQGALLVLLALALLAAWTLLRSPFHYATQDREAISADSSPQHRAGTDDLGRDRGVRMAAALLLGMAGAIAAAALTTGIAAAVGITAAFASAGVSRTLMYLCDLLLTLPWLFLLLTVRSALPLNLAPVLSAAVTFLLLALLGWPAYARIAYAGSRAIRRSEWMVQAHAAGLTPLRIARAYVLPHLRPLLLTQFLLCIPAFLIAEANLGAIGLGISEPLPSWGSMLLELEHPYAYTGSALVYVPVILLVGVLLLLEMLVLKKPQVENPVSEV